MQLADTLLTVALVGGYSGRARLKRFNFIALGDSRDNFVGRVKSRSGRPELMHLHEQVYYIGCDSKVSRSNKLFI